MAKIRVLRLIEYVYDSVEVMEKDRTHWHIQGSMNPNGQVKIKSTVLPLEVLDDKED